MLKKIKDFFSKIFHKNEIKQIADTNTNIKNTKNENEDFRECLIKMEKDLRTKETNSRIKQKSKIPNRLEIVTRPGYTNIMPNQNMNMKLY